MPYPSPPEQADPNTKARQLYFDWEEWLPYLAESDTTDAEKRAMIEALWSIVIAFVDLGWEVGDTPPETCGQSLDLTAALRSAVVDSHECSKPDDPSILALGTEDAAHTSNKKEPV